MRIALVCVLLLAIYSCKKEPTTWDTEIGLPLLRTQLDLTDLVPDSLLEYDDHNNVFLRLQEEIFNIGIDSLISIEGDTIEKLFSIAPIIEFEFEPGTTFISEDDGFAFDNIDVQLREAKIKDGVIVLYASNSIPSPLNFTLSIPGASLNGVPLEVLVLVPPGTDTENGSITFEIDLAGYQLDLTGATGNSHNTLSISYEVQVPKDSPAVTVYDSDIVELKMTYDALEIEYAIGYLGTQIVDIDESSNFEILESLKDAELDIFGAEANITFSNSFGVDMQAFIYQIQAWNTSNGNEVNLQSDMIGSNISLSRASFDYVHLDPFQKSFLLNQDNSNLDSFIELIPDSIRVQANANLNPFENISNFNDFVVDVSRLTCEMDIQIPFKLGLSNLALKDTSYFNWSITNPEIHSVVLYVVVDNTFPADVELSLVGLDQEMNESILFDDYLDPNSSPYIGGRIDNVSGESILVYNLDEALISSLTEMEYLVFNASFQTTEYPSLVTFRAEDQLDILISADINMKVEVK